MRDKARKGAASHRKENTMINQIADLTAMRIVVGHERRGMDKRGQQRAGDRGALSELGRGARARAHHAHKGDA